MLRALTLILEDKGALQALQAIADQGGLTVGVLSSLLHLVLSDTVLTVARALHVLAPMTEPGLIDKAVFRYVHTHARSRLGLLNT